MEERSAYLYLSTIYTCQTSNAMQQTILVLQSKIVNTYFRLLSTNKVILHYSQLFLQYWISDRLNSSDVRPKMKVISHLSCQAKYLFAAL